MRLRCRAAPPTYSRPARRAESRELCLSCPTEHEPVLAAELVDAARPAAGADRGRLHLRRRRPRAR